MKKNCESKSPYYRLIKKIMLMAKLTGLLVLIFSLHLTASVYSQSVRLSLDLKQKTIKEVLQQVEADSEFRFIYENEKLDLDKTVNINVTDKTVEEILDQLFTNEAVEYKITSSKLIIIKPLKDVVSQKQIKLTGKVTDTSGQPLPGVTVVVKGTTNGTITNFDGVYHLSDVPSNGTIQFSFVGMKMQEIEVEGQSVIKVVMQEDAIGIEEVVAIGYGSQKKVNLTGAVTSVDVDDLDGRVITNSNQALQGKIAGVNIVQNSGQAGDEEVTIRIRGVSSIDNNNDPLLIIDGTEGNFNDVHPSDIKSISVLKDAASAAIYGSRASAGVIIIETKQGKQGLQIDYNGTTSIQSPTRLPDVVDSWTHAELRNVARNNVGLGEIFTQERIELYKYQIAPNYPNTDWYDVYFQNSFMHNHYLNARGGDKNYNFSSSVGYKDQDGILIGTSSKKISLRNNLNATFLDDKVKISLNLSGYNTKNEELISSTNTVMSEIAGMSPIAFIRSVDELTGDEGLYSYQGRYIGAMNLGGGINREYNYVNAQASIEVKPVKNLLAKVLIGGNKFKSDYDSYSPEFYTTSDILENAVNKRESELQKTWSQTDNRTFTALLKYNYHVKKHWFTVLAAYERLGRTYKYDMGYVKELSSNQPIFDYGDPTSHFLESRANKSGTVSYFGRLNYSYKGKYLFEANVRRDGSSRFKDKWGVFPSVSVGWRPTEEKFLKSLDFLSLKLRASWGRLGNQNINSYYAASDQMSGSEYYAFGNYIVPGRGTTILANPETTWETTEQVNIGFDAVLWNRFNLTVDYFDKMTTDILAKVTIPPSLGVTTSPYQNIGDMSNKGIELSMGYVGKKYANGFSYSVNGNFSILHNEVTSLGILDFVDHTSEIRSQVGESFASFYGYKLEGIYQVADFNWQNENDNSIPHEERDYILKEGLADPSGIMSNPAPGDMKIIDQNKDGFITPDDKTIIGRSIPKINYGFSVNLSYKRFSLNIIGQGVADVDAYMTGTLIAPFWNSGNGTMLQSTADNYWTIENQSNKYIRLYEDKARDALTSDYYLHNASYFRLKSLELSYNLPDYLINKWGAKRCRVFVTAENLMLLTNFVEGFDPERNYTRTTANFHPQTETFSLGVNLSF